MSRNFRLLVLVFLCVVTFGQVVETLPALPQHTKVFFFASSGSDVLVGSGNGNTGALNLSTIVDGKWATRQLEWDKVPLTREKAIEGGTLASSVVSSIGDVVYSGSTFAGTKKPANLTLKIAGSSITQLCMSSSYEFFTVDGNSKVPLTNLVGVFPSKDGKIYFTGTREGQFNSVFSSGVYTLDTVATLGCSFREIFTTTSSSYKLLNIWKVSNGFVGERFPRNPQNTETEIVYFLPTGEETVLASSVTPAKVVTTKCCDLVFDPEAERGLFTSIGSDSRPHLKWLDTLKDVLEVPLPGFSARVADIKGDYAVLAVGRSSIKFDSVMWINLKTKEFKLFNTGSFITDEYIDPRFLKINKDGIVYVAIVSDAKPDTDKVYKILPTAVPPPPLVAPTLEPIAPVEVGSTVTVTCKGCIVTDATTTLLINGIDTAFNNEGGVLRFLAPSAGQYTLSVKVTNSTESVKSNEVLLTTVEPKQQVYIYNKEGYLELYDTEDWEPVSDGNPVLPGKVVMGFVDYRNGANLTMSVDGVNMPVEFEDINSNTAKFFVRTTISYGYASILKVMDGDRLVGEFWFNTLPPPSE